MDQRIIYKTENGGVAIVIPSPEFLQENTINDLVIRTVPANTPYKIVRADEVPSDRTFRDAWEYKE